MKRRKTAQDQKLHEQNRLARMWRQWHRTLCAEALEGPHSALVREVFQILRTMTLRDTRILGLANSTDWRTVDRKTREILLHEIDRRIIALREQTGLPPFDDALPGQKLNGFLVIKSLMTETPPDASGQT